LDVVVTPLIGPRFCGERPSPKSTRTFARLAPVVGVTLNVTTVPAVVAFGLALNAAKPNALTLTVSSALERAPDVALTFAVDVVVNIATAMPLESVVAADGEMLPLSVLKVTGTPPSGPPPSSITEAVSCTDPPDDPRVCGFALRPTVLAAAVPILMSLFCAEAPPEYAVITGLPLVPAVTSFTCTDPLWVRASEGSIRPIVVVKVTSVPF
jgi:hypothetical protein